MKISDAVITITSQNSSQQMDLMLKEESRPNITRTIPGPPRNRLAFDGTNLFPVMVVDRVSISQNKQVEFQSGYTANISSRSGVRSEDTDETKVFEHTEMLETLVGGVIDKTVVVRHIQQRKNLSIDTGPGITKPPQETGSVSIGLSSGEQILSLKQTDIRFEEEQITFASTGEVITEDGRTIEFSLDLSMDRAFLSKTEQKTLIHTWQEQVNLTDPLVISLTGGLPRLSDTSFEFDLDNDGDKEKVSFVSPGSGFLAFDRNGDQKINNGSELFGPGTGNGFGELAALDGDNNRWIDENDAVFSKLSVWTKDENGKEQLISLKDAGIGAIFLESSVTNFDLATPDNTLKGRLKSSGLFLFENGNVGSIQQIDLAARPVEIEKNNSQLNLDGNSLVSGAFVPERSLMFSNPGPRAGSVVGSAAGGGTLDGQPVENPLEALVEQIKALKEEMDIILGKRSHVQGLDHSFEFVPSDYQLYQMTNLDQFVLFSGRNISPGQDRYA